MSSVSKDPKYSFSKSSNKRDHYAKTLAKRRENLLALKSRPDVDPKTFSHKLYCTTKGRTDKDQAPHLNVNNIVKRYNDATMLPLARAAFGQYRDVVDAPSYEAGLNIVANANEMFAQLPSDVRKRFGNNPAEFLRAYDDPEQKAYLQKLGVLPPEAPTPTPEAEKASKKPSAKPEATSE